MNWRAAFLLLLLPGAGLAQNVATVTPTYANRAGCASTTSTVRLSWVSATTPATGDVFRVAAYAGGTAAACATTVPDAGSSATVASDINGPSATSSVEFFLSKMASAASVSCSAADDAPVMLCVYLVPLLPTATASLVAAKRFDFWLAVPPAPVFYKVTPANSAINVQMRAGTATTTETAVGTDVNYTVVCTPPATGGNGPVQATGNATQTLSCGGLTNDVTYALTAYATSAAGKGNQGATVTYAGDPANATPLNFIGFWGTYQAAGGVEEGGCGTGGAGVLAPAAALLALLALRRRRP